MIYLDSTAIETFLTCREAYRRRYIENIVPEHPSIHLAFGHAVHKAVEYWHKGWEYKKCLYFAAEEMEAVDENAFAPKDREKWQEMALSLPAMVAVYCDGVEPQLNAEIEQEWMFETSLFPGLVTLCGKIDRYADGVLYDVKTASEIGRTWHHDYKQTLLRTFQFGLYDWYKRQTEDAPVAVKVECIVKPWKDKPCRLEVFDLPEILAYRTRFDQQLLWVVTEIQRYHERYLEHKPWPMAGSQICQGKFSPCDYLPLCNQGDVPHVMDKYKQREEHLVCLKSLPASSR